MNSDPFVSNALRLIAFGLAPYLAEFLGPRRPFHFSFTVTEVITAMGKTFTVTVHLPTLPAASDIGAQELVVTINGTAAAPVKVPLDALDVPLGEFKEGDVITADLAYIDDSPAANRGAHRVESLTVVDTFPPPEPGEFGFHVDEVLTP